ncbi:hypothetical protein HYH03_009696 [Edaphochlamys debaryana]|uniref:t-SNARE coiled-coil homology domain-containing protein n=1 Tax=Edaphochlamys debaryana TaxID=47281 RepID=A0A836BWX7_9CHLO|nr:hypothetical protein HYH03_009696 [Edaphochlamys debaryana]|eukprot:KAG2491965.1 hypothetical protein HYH03_009696 [Edaphochlamys debaryana]
MSKQPAKITLVSHGSQGIPIELYTFAGEREQEQQCQKLWIELDKLFVKLEKAKKDDRVHALVKEINLKLKEAKAMIKDFEREAKADGMAVEELSARKKALAVELNHYIKRKGEFAQAHGSTQDLLAMAVAQPEIQMEAMSTQQLMQEGRKVAAATDKTLDQSLQVVSQMQGIGKEVASTLHDQSQQLDRVLDNMHEATFTMKKARVVVRDIARGLLTDKCIAFLLLLVVCGVVAIIVLKVVNPKAIQKGAAAALDPCNLGSDLLSRLNTTLLNCPSPSPSSSPSPDPASPGPTVEPGPSPSVDPSPATAADPSPDASPSPDTTSASPDLSPSPDEASSGRRMLLLHLVRRLHSGAGR